MGANQPTIRALTMKALGRFGAAFLILGAIFFLSAGTLSYREAWGYLAVLCIPAFCVLAYLIRNNPELLERRMRMREKEAEQKLIVKLGYVIFLAAFLLPGFDRRYGRTSVQLSGTLRQTGWQSGG